jgi:hypothetical protein
MDEDNAQRLAEILGGEIWDSGGGICLVLKHRSDGKIVAISDETISVYGSEEGLISGDKPLESILLV